MKPTCCLVIFLLHLSIGVPINCQTFPIVETRQWSCFDDKGKLSKQNTNTVNCPQEGQPYFGQDANYEGRVAAYSLLKVSSGSKDSVVLVQDHTTGLTWMQQLAFDPSGKPQRLTYAQALDFVKKLNEEAYGGYRDWRMPNIKELYSLIDFNGSSSSRPPRPYIDTNYFEYIAKRSPDGPGPRKMGPPPGRAPQLRPIDGQCWSATLYTGKIFGQFEAAFGVNFADGRIKGYPTTARGRMGRQATHYLRCVRGNDSYGVNRFVDNGDNTISDLATGLMWTKYDSHEQSLFNASASTMDWETALKTSENLVYAGYNDWRLPNAKELQSIVDYTRSPQHPDASKRGAAIDPVFSTPDETAWYWTSTTHMEDRKGLGSFAIYICFGEATGKNRFEETVDVHGAGAQRSDPKSEAVCQPDWLINGLGPQRDEIRINHVIRCVRTIPDG